MDLILMIVKSRVYDLIKHRPGVDSDLSGPLNDGLTAAYQEGRNSVLTEMQDKVIMEKKMVTEILDIAAGKEHGCL